MKDRTEQQLIEQVMAGKRKAAQQLYEMHKHSLFMVCLRYAKDRATAQDYLQEAFIKIFKNLHQFDVDRGVFESWAKRIAINTCLMDLRKRTLYAVNISEAEKIESTTGDVVSDLSLREMLALIKELPDGYKTVFNMYVIDGYSHKEIAAELSISISTSKTQLMKARQLLQKKIISNQLVFNQNHG